MSKMSRELYIQLACKVYL